MSQNRIFLESAVISGKQTFCDGKIVRLSIHSRRIARHAIPGQFIEVKCDDGYQPFLKKPFSIFNVQDNGCVDILVKVVGNGTELLSMKKKGDKIQVMGPLGNGFPVVDNAYNIILVGGGTGIAPLYFFSKCVNSKKKSIMFFAGYACMDECVSLNRRNGVEYILSTDDGSMGYRGFASCCFESWMKKNKDSIDMERTVVYSCGPRPMLIGVRKICGSYKLKCYLSLEEYMACGIGVCMGCAVKTVDGYKTVCSDGPVFDSEEVIL